MVTARVEPNYLINGFYTKQGGRAYGYGQRGHIEDLPITPRQRLEDVIQVISGLNFGGTDCSLPMLLAIEKEYEIDTFIIYTDNETWAGEIMTPTQFSIADPNDAGMLDVAGFDTSTPQVISEFSK
jgi:60 kDa SS-A/Ro ribonucleoprotein